MPCKIRLISINWLYLDNCCWLFLIVFVGFKGSKYLWSVDFHYKWHHSWRRTGRCLRLCADYNINAIKLISLSDFSRIFEFEWKKTKHFLLFGFCSSVWLPVKSIYQCTFHLSRQIICSYPVDCPVSLVHTQYGFSTEGKRVKRKYHLPSDKGFIEKRWLKLIFITNDHKTISLKLLSFECSRLLYLPASNEVWTCIECTLPNGIGLTNRTAWANAIETLCNQAKAPILSDIETELKSLCVPITKA